MSDQTATTLLEGYRAFQRGDLETLSAVFADDIRWHSYGASPLAGDYNGLQEVFGLFGGIAELTDSYEQQVHDLLANDDHAVALVESTAVVDGDTFTGRAVHVMHLDDDGVVTEAWIQPLDHHAYEEFWADRG